MKKAILLLFTMVITQTAIGQRWYDYVTDILQPYEVSIGQDVNYWYHHMWYDTSALFGVTGSTSGPAYRYNYMVSMGLGLDPIYPEWNTPAFTGMIGVTPFTPFTVDSVSVPALYGRSYASPAKNAVVDTLVFSFVCGRGFSGADLDSTASDTFASHYMADSCVYPRLDRDSNFKKAAHYGGTSTTHFYTFLLNSNDTTSMPGSKTTYPRPGHVPPDPVISFSVAPMQKMAMTVTYKSGDPSYPIFPLKDTTIFSSGTAITGVKYNYWQAQVYAAVTTMGSRNPVWPRYDSSNFACGYFLLDSGRLYNKRYQPNWALASDTPTVPSPSIYQYPNIRYHIRCPVCPILMPGPAAEYYVQAPANVKAYPNPANSEMIISYGQLSNSPVTISLTNMLGQVVAIEKAENGRAKFDVSALPAGIYMYTIPAEGHRVTGRASIIH